MDFESFFKSPAKLAWTGLLLFGGIFSLEKASIQPMAYLVASGFLVHAFILACNNSRK